jgi:hypothetical protein
VKAPFYRILLALGVLAGGPTTQAATAWEQNRLIPLLKLTVGPWDNFEATVTEDDHWLYFTRDQNQIPNIFQQDLQTDRASVLIGAQGDAKSPTLDKTGRLLAITFYGKDAQGDICLFSLQNRSIECVTSSDTVDESPFWIDASHLGFLSRSTAQPDWELILYDIETKAKQTVHRGLISAPIASPDGRYILFNQTTPQNDVRLHVYDLQTQTLRSLPRFDLSGITGFLAFSTDGAYLYFNHYLNDTNFDQVIDGNDHSVVFRVPFEQLLSATAPLLPEQLTSVADNCKFPALTPQYLYLTCAFEGSLDIYRLPLSGTIPPDWNERQFWEAHRTARTYEARLLLLNAFRYRFKRNDAEMLERLLSNHLEIGELTTAAYYIKQLETLYQKAGNHRLARFYETLGRLLHVRSSKLRVPVNVVTARYQRLVSESRKQTHATHAWPRLLALMDAYYDYEIEHYDQALANLERVDLAAPMLPLERYLAFDLYLKLLTVTQPQRLLAIYPLMFNDSTLEREARLYYAFNYLKLLARVWPKISARMKILSKQIKQAPHGPVAELFRAEAASLELTQSQTQPAKNKAFKRLTDLLKANQHDLLLRKAMHVRAIQILGEAEQFQYMELLSRHWLTTTHVSEMEFVNVAEQYAVITMDKAYGMLARGDLAKAYTTFYSAIRQTNDLEAHYQFIALGLSADLNKRDNLETSYQLLEKQKLLGQNGLYVKALRLIFENNGQHKTPIKVLDKALALVQPMRVRGLNPAMRDLLMGYIYHQKLRATQAGYRYDKTFFQKAHYHYIMALDLARDNSRIRASVLENLAWLHFEVRNYALSADFFQWRMKLPFVNLESEAMTRWAYARALFYNNEPEKAWHQAEAALALARRSPTLKTTPFLEKTAFYAMQAEAYRQAVSYYEELFGAKHHLSDRNRATALLGYGYALMKRGETEKARQSLHELLQLSAKLKPQTDDTTRLLSFHPQRLQLLAYGFLSKLAANPRQRARYRSERIHLLQAMQGHSAEFGYDEAKRLSFLVKDFQHQAIAFEAAGFNEQMVASMDQALQGAVRWVQATDDKIGPVIYRTLVNYLSLGLSHPKVFAGRSAKLLDKTCRGALEVFAQSPYRPPVVIAQQAKLTLLWAAYRDHVLGQDSGKLPQTLNAVIETPEVQQLRSGHPELYKELREIADAFI